MLYLERLLIAGGYPVVALTFFPLLLWVSVVGLRQLVFRRLAVREEPLDEALILGVGAMGRLTGEDLAERGRRRVSGYLAFGTEQMPSATRPARCWARWSAWRRCCARCRWTSSTSRATCGSTARRCRRPSSCASASAFRSRCPRYPFRMDRARPEHSHAVSDGYLHFVTYAPRPHQMAIKRLFDIVSSAAALLVLSPLLVAVAVAIKLTSRGPIFFKQQRVGLHGKPFNMLKFRSMVVNAEELQAPSSRR